MAKERAKAKVHAGLAVDLTMHRSALKVVEKERAKVDGKAAREPKEDTPRATVEKAVTKVKSLGD